MADVLQQSSVQPSKHIESKEALRVVRSLDDLLERYLHLLDQYQSLQQSLARLLSEVRIDLAGFFGPILNPYRVICHLLKPIFQVLSVFATARIITMIGCKHQLVCTAPFLQYAAIHNDHKLLIPI